MRARNIKPSFFTNEEIGTLEPIVGLLFIGLWCLADRDGILEDRPVRIKAELFPYREKLDINGYLTVLARSNHILRYEVDGKRYIKVINFEKHQHPHHTEKSKNYPQPQALSCITVKQPLDNGYSPSDSLIPDSLIPDSKSAKRARFDPACIDLPSCIPNHAWQEWVAYRKNLGKRVQEQTWFGMVQKLVDLNNKGHAPEKVIAESIANGWQGLFELKTKGINGNANRFDTLAATAAALTGRIGTTDFIEGHAIQVD